MKKVLNVFGIIFAVLFSLALIPTLITAPIWTGVSGLLQPEVIEEVTAQVVAEIDLTEVSLNNPELLQSLTEAGLSPEAAQVLLSSQTAHQMVVLLGNDFAQVLQGSFQTSSLTEAELLRIAEENRAELIQIMRLMAPAETAALTDDQVSQAVDLLLHEQVLPMLADLNPAMLDLQSQLHEDFAVAMELLTGPVVTMALLIAALVLAVLIFLCRWPQQKGLLWLGIDAALAALPVLGLAFSLKGAQISQTLSQGAGLPDVFGPVLHRAGNSVLIGGLLLAAAAAALIGGFILLRDRRLKKQAAHADYAPDLHADYAPAEPVITGPADRERSPWDNV